MRTCIFAFAALITIQGGTTSADIYRFVDDEGTVCYTDAPQHHKASLIYRDPRKPDRNERESKTTRHSSSDHIGMQNSTTKSTTFAPLTGSGSLPVSGRVTSLTGLRIDPIDGILRRHNGMDIAIPKGTPVSPVAPGTVVYSGRRSGYGNMVVVDHGGAHTVYAHHDRNSVSEGETVTERTVIAYSGSSGRSTGPHLHFEAWENGVNITERFTGTDGAPLTVARASLVHTAPFRKAVQSDGSLLFTNLPLEHP